MLAPILSDYLSRAGWDPQSAAASAALFDVTLHAENLLHGPRAPRSYARRAAPRGKPKARTQPAWRELFAVPAAESFLRVHLFEGVRWFSKEALELLLSCLSLVQSVDGERALDAGPLLDAAEKSGYRWDDFLELLDPGSA
jgi:hypothetical protein